MQWGWGGGALSISIYYVKLEIVDFSICAIISIKTFVNSEVSDKDKLNILRCAKMGQLFSLLDPHHCYSPLTQGPCETDEVIVIDQKTLLGKN